MSQKLCSLLDSSQPEQRDSYKKMELLVEKSVSKKMPGLHNYTQDCFFKE